MLEHKGSYPARTEPARNCCPFELNGEVVEDTARADNHSGPGSDGRIWEISRQGWPRNITHELDSKRQGKIGLRDLRRQGKIGLLLLLGPIFRPGSAVRPERNDFW